MVDFCLLTSMSSYLFYCNSILGCRVIQDLGLCKLEDFVTSQGGHKIKGIHKIWNICANTTSTGLKFCRVDVLTELHILIVAMMSP